MIKLNKEKNNNSQITDFTFARNYDKLWVTKLPLQ